MANAVSASPSPGWSQQRSDIDLPMRARLAVIFCVLCLAGCTKHNRAVRLSEDQCRVLVNTANEMVMKPGTPFRGSYGVPSDRWPEAIRRLKPVAVYYHLVNVVIVMERNEREERGYYVQTLISSYGPSPNEPNWTWVPVGNGSSLFAYTRKR